MNGDNPSVEFEGDTQKSGQFGCSGGGGDMRWAYKYDYTWLTRSTETLKRNKTWY